MMKYGTRTRTRTLTLRRAITRLRSAAGAIDLASILVGVLVMGVLGSVIAASVFVVIPWAQDSAARSSLDSVKIAQSLSQVKDGKFRNWSDLLDAEFVTGSGTVDTVVDSTGDCYVSAAKSSSGTTFYRTSRDNTVLDDKAGPPDTNWCVSSTRALADAVVNLATNPSFESGGGAVTIRTNLLSNPGAETNTSGWQGYGNSADYTRSTADAKTGVASLRLAPVTSGYKGMQSAVQVNAGITYTFSAYTNRTAGSGAASVAIEWWSSTGTYISTVSTDLNPVSGTWQRTSVSGQAPAGATSAYALIRYTGAGANTDVLYGDAALFEPSPALGTYFDGSTVSGDPDLQNVWTSAAHSSPSAQNGVGAAGVWFNTDTYSTWAKEYQSAAWSSSGATSMKMRGDGAHGDQFIEAGNLFPLQPNKSYTFAAKVKTTAAITDPYQLRLRYNISGIGDKWAGTGVTGPAGVHDFRASFSTTGMTAVNFFRMMNGVNSPGLATYWDDVMLVEIPDLDHPYTGPYFDGSSVNGAWNGAANASSSTGWIRR